MNGGGLSFGGFGNFFWKFHSWEFLSEDFSGELFMKTDYDDEVCQWQDQTMLNLMLTNPDFIFLGMKI